MTGRTEPGAGGDRRVTIRELGAPGDLGWVVMAHGEVYAAEFGWNPSFEALVARIVADYSADHDPSRQSAWIAEVDGVRRGCVFCVPAAEDGTAKLRILLVDPAARGLGLGDRLVSTCLEFAAAAGYRRITLWTNDVLVAARRIYQAHGFRLVDSAPHRSFGHDLVGQNWVLDLPAARVGAGAAR
ncbi:GNAT family N-acetyltransferase [Pseudonocardia lacus]|uniref:GNAT family N-acetyltransferase n=1 Tax=Pseudonocardia lacus TaxID=2835865 RepID=UPI001BDD92A0|nr:GNAT family N-acetyltransferase [Pseudonocardia lacus]